jgi:hypothetical protein
VTASTSHPRLTNAWRSISQAYAPTLLFPCLILCCSALSAAPPPASPATEQRYIWVAEQLLTPSLQAAGAPVLLVETPDGTTVATSRECDRISQGTDHWLCGRIAVPGNGVFVLKAADEGAPTETGIVLNPSLRLSPGVFDVALVLDASQSMRKNDPTGLRLKAAEQFWSLSRESRRIRTLSFIVFREDVDVLLKPTPPRQIEDLGPVLRRLRGHGSTDFNPPFKAARSLLQGGEGQQSAVLFLSDGKPIRTYRDTHKQLGSLGCPVHTVGLSPEADGELLSRIAEDTGGRFFAAPTADELQQIFARIFALIASPKSVVHRIIEIDGDRQLPLQIDTTMHNPVITIASLRGRTVLTLDGKPLPTANAELASFRLGTAGSRQHLLKISGQGRILCDLAADTDLLLTGEVLNPKALAGLPLTAFLYLQGGENIVAPQLNCTLSTPGGDTHELPVTDSGFGLYRVGWQDTSAPGQYIASARLTGTLSGAPVIRETFLLFTRTAEAGPKRSHADHVPPKGLLLEKASIPRALAAERPARPVASPELTATCRFSPTVLQFPDLYPGERLSEEVEILVHAVDGALPEYHVENDNAQVLVSATGELNDSRTSTLTITVAPTASSAGEVVEATLVVAAGGRRWDLRITGKIQVPTIEAKLGPMTVTEETGGVHAKSTLAISLAPSGRCPLTVTTEQTGLSTEWTECVVAQAPVEATIVISPPVPAEPLVWRGAVTISGPGLESVLVPVKFAYGQAQPGAEGAAGVERPLPPTPRFSMTWLLPLLLLLALLALLACLRAPERTPFFVASALVHALILIWVLPRAAQQDESGSPVTVMTVTNPPPVIENVVPAETETETDDDDAPAEAPAAKSASEPAAEAADQSKEMEATDAASPAAPEPDIQELPPVERSEVAPAAVQEESGTELERKRAEPETPVQESQTAENRKNTVELPSQAGDAARALLPEQVDLDAEIAPNLSADTPQTSRAHVDLRSLPAASEPLPVQKEATVTREAHAAPPKQAPTQLTASEPPAVQAADALKAPAPEADAQPERQLDPRSLPTAPMRPAVVESLDVSMPPSTPSAPPRTRPSTTDATQKATPSPAAATAVTAAQHVRSVEGMLKATETLPPEANSGGPPASSPAEPAGTPASVSAPVLPSSTLAAQPASEAPSDLQPKRKSAVASGAPTSAPAPSSNAAAAVAGEALSSGALTVSDRKLTAPAAPPSPTPSAAPMLRGNTSQPGSHALPMAAEGLVSASPRLPSASRSATTAPPGGRPGTPQPRATGGSATHPSSEAVGTEGTVTSQPLDPGEPASHVGSSRATPATSPGGIGSVARIPHRLSDVVATALNAARPLRHEPSQEGGGAQAATTAPSRAASLITDKGDETGSGQTLGVNDTPAGATTIAPGSGLAPGVNSAVSPSTVAPALFTPAVLSGPTETVAVTDGKGRGDRERTARSPRAAEGRIAYVPEPPPIADLPVPRQIEVDTSRIAHARPTAALQGAQALGDGLDGRRPTGNRWRRTFPNLQHSGDWDCDRTAMLNLAHQFERRTGSTMPFDSRNVRVDAAEISRAPFLFMSGHKDFRFTASEVNRLQEYLKEGGYLWINDSTDVADQTFDQAVRRELPRVLPAAPLRRIPADHTLFRGPYDLTGGYKGFPVPPGDKYRQDHLEGVWIEGRLKVIYTRNDYGDGLEIDERTGPLMASLTDLTADEMQESSIRMGTNIAMYCINDGELSETRLASAPDDALLPLRVRARQKWDGATGTALTFIRNPDEWGMPDGWQGSQFLDITVRRATGRTPGIRVDFDRGEHAFQGWRSQALIGHANSFHFTREHVILVDVTSYLPGGGRVAVAFSATGAVPYIETQAQFVRPGRNRNVPFDLGQRTFKTGQTGWQHRAPWPDDHTPDTIFLVVYPQGEKGRVDLTNLRVTNRPKP